MNCHDPAETFDGLLEQTLHRETQVEGNSVSLTAAGIYEVERPADLDFGGGEYSAAGTRPLEVRKRSPEDDYGWWELDRGSYVLKLNEKLELEGDRVGLLQPHPHLLEAGATHPTLVVDEELQNQLKLPLNVPNAGVSIKENARVSSLLIF